LTSTITTHTSTIAMYTSNITTHVNTITTHINTITVCTSNTTEDWAGAEAKVEGLTTTASAGMTDNKWVQTEPLWCHYLMLQPTNLEIQCAIEREHTSTSYIVVISVVFV
jgi:hypothetical protein